MEASYSCTECAAFEFQPENVAPVHNNRNHFLRSQWNIPWLVYVIYRVVVALLFTAWILADFFDEAGKFYKDDYAIWLVFATNWGFLLLGVCAVMHAVIVLTAYVKSKHCVTGNQSNASEYELLDQDVDGFSSTLPCLMSLPENLRGLDIPLMIFWVLYNCSANGALVVTTSYWTFLVTADKAGFLINTMSRLKHTLNTVYVVFDLLFSATPIRIFHVIYPLFWGAIYTVFNVVYFTNNGLGPNGKPYAYYVMDWRNPLESALTCSIGFILSTVMQCVLYGLYRLRLFVYAKLTHARYDSMTLDDAGSLLSGDVGSPSDDEADNILPAAVRNRAASYSSTETMERETAREKAENGVGLELADVVRAQATPYKADIP
ncbi:hypothetical protein LSH36_1126g00036 [Paralvinella palmiformis]|uniref:Uncharacterized protein n=1 Tax=Paralvinella palmiformis TaxID=53620 RepID=A0AAD9MRD3_9ANNE|nr:hypothetical protein LSH36_1126g00036 [Paralvinella palmiformis]